jgi:hypothetical protein
MCNHKNISNTLKIILIYSLILAAVRIGSGIIVQLFPTNFHTPLTLILFIPILFATWYISNQGTTKLSQKIKNKRELKYKGYLIPTVSVVTLAFAEYLLVGEVGIAGSMIALAFGMLGAERAAKEVD